MAEIISYESPDVVNNEITLPTTLTTSEVAIFLTTDQKYLRKSQLTIMSSVVLSGLTTVTYNYYITPAYNVTTPSSTVWYPITLYATSTGVMTQRSALLNSTSYSDSTSWYMTDNVPLSATMAFRITGKVNTGTPAHTLAVYSRDN